MAARSLATATISFGLVTIPVRLYSATQASAGVSFNLLHKACGSRLKQQYICPREDVVVPREDMVKGYAVSKDQYVTFTDEELKALEEKATKTIDIVEFLPASEVDPVYYDKPYYLGPDKGGDKAYTLLSRVMEETGRVALGRYAARGRQYLVLLRPKDGRMVMQQLLYHDEVRTADEVPKPDAQIRDPELKLAKQLVDQITSDTFRPEAYEDEVKKRVLEDIQKKAEGEVISAEPVGPAPAPVIDLMEALKASLAGRPGAAPMAERRRGPAPTLAGSSEAEEADGAAEEKAAVNGKGANGGRKPPRAAPRAQARERKASASRTKASK